MVLTEAVAPYYVEAWRKASVNTLEKIECSLNGNHGVYIDISVLMGEQYMLYRQQYRKRGLPGKRSSHPTGQFWDN